MAEDQVQEQAQAEATETQSAPDGLTMEMELFGKYLDKMTVKELRELALGLKEIVGVHGMQKDELIESIREVKGIVLAEGEKKHARAIRRIKAEIRELRQSREQAREAGENKKVDQLRKRIGRLKKQTRRLAAAN